MRLDSTLLEPDLSASWSPRAAVRDNDKRCMTGSVRQR